MTVWLLQQKLTPEEEANIQQRTHVLLPFEGMPDLSMVGTQSGYKHLIRVLHPDAPPETIAKMTDRTWRVFSNIHVEDIIAVPLQASKEVVVGEVTGPYEHKLGEDREDIHLLPVKWHEKRVPFRSFRKFPTLLDEHSSRRMFEVDTAPARTVIRDSLPHSYNRFAKLKWLLVLFFAWRLVVHMMHAGSALDQGGFP